MFPQFDLDTTWVLEHLFMLSGRIVVGTGPAIGLATWMAAWPVPPRAERAPSGARISATAVAGVLETHPWVKEYTTLANRCDTDVESDPETDPTELVVAQAVEMEAQHRMAVPDIGDREDLYANAV